MSLANHRPRSVGELVDATFTFYRANFVTIVIVALVIVAPTALVKLVAPAEYGRVVDFFGNLLIPIGQGAIALIVAATVERGERIDAGPALRGAFGRTGSLLAVQIASGLMVVIGFILLIVPALIALVWTAVCVPAVMVEQIGYSKAIDRSRALSRGRFKHVLGTAILTWGIVLLLMIGLGIVMGFGGIDGALSEMVVDFIFGLLFPAPAIAMALLYYDLRVRNESADLDAMISGLPAPTATPAP